MKKTLLLCFIHGFKGGEDTFGAKSEFAEHLAALLSASLPKIEVRAITYPKYETRGDLGECVTRFRDWLTDKVIDLEVENGTPSPTVDPSVRIILVGHSMGGIVAAETAIAITGDKIIPHSRAEDDADEVKIEVEGEEEGGGAQDGPQEKDREGIAPHQNSSQEGERATAKASEGEREVSSNPKIPAEENLSPRGVDSGNKRKRETATDGNDEAEANGGEGPKKSPRPTTTHPSSPKSPPHPHLNDLMFPYIQGVLAFDTPFLGISPGVVAHGAEGHYNKAAATVAQLSSLSGMLFGGGGGNSSSSSSSSNNQQNNRKKAEEEEAKKKSGGGGWGRWGTIAAVAGAGAAIAAGGAAAYVNRDQITSGWGWATSHLEFVGCLARGEELRRRVASMVRLQRELGVGFANVYTRLGDRGGGGMAGLIVGGGGGGKKGSGRTFCNLPKKKSAEDEHAGLWVEAVNDRAEDETGAHMAMFEAKLNSGYSRLSEDARNLIVGWARGGEWYETSTF